MNYKLIKKLSESGKMQVTPIQSEILQRALFEMGYGWIHIEEQQRVSAIDKPYLFWDGDEFKWLSTLDSNEKVLFEADENPLHLFDNHFEINP